MTFLIDLISAAILIVWAFDQDGLVEGCAGSYNRDEVGASPPDGGGNMPTYVVDDVECDTTRYPPGTVGGSGMPWADSPSVIEIDRARKSPYLKLSVRSALRASHDAIRTQLWPLPILGVVLAVTLGVVVPYVDGRFDANLPGWLNSVVFSGDAGAARTVLDAVASSLITVTPLTFSLTVVTLQLASSQFSPRLLRTFTQDIFVQVTLAIFLATFTFSLTVLRSVRSSQESAKSVRPPIGGYDLLLARHRECGLSRALPRPLDPADPGRDHAAERPPRRVQDRGRQPHTL